MIGTLHVIREDSKYLGFRSVIIVDNTTISGNSFIVYGPFFVVAMLNDQVNKTFLISPDDIGWGSLKLTSQLLDGTL